MMKEWGNNRSYRHPRKQIQWMVLYFRLSKYWPLVPAFFFMEQNPGCLPSCWTRYAAKLSWLAHEGCPGHAEIRPSLSSLFLDWLLVLQLEPGQSLELANTHLPWWYIPYASPSTEITKTLQFRNVRFALIKCWSIQDSSLWCEWNLEINLI